MSVTSENEDRPEICGRQECGRQCMIVDRGEPDDSRLCMDCWIAGRAKEILVKALDEIHDLGFCVRTRATDGLLMLHQLKFDRWPPDES